MLLYGVRWPGVMICMTLYCATFLLARYSGEDTSGYSSEQTGLLLFMLPARSRR